MIEFLAAVLMTHDEFTVDQGETWHKVKFWRNVLREACRGMRIVVITTDGREFIFKSKDLVIVKS